ncbi:MAG: GNAT family N-acetyltransferase [Acidimicrobiia bacterium]
MSLELRSIRPDELRAVAAATRTSFGVPMPDDFALDGWRGHELDRVVAAFDGPQVVGTGRNYSLELTLPGGTVVPAAGVSWIGTLPTHRRRGVLRSMLHVLFDDATTRREPVAILNASEGGIYRRFGFGEATFSAAIEVDRATAALRDADVPGRVRLVTRADARERFPDLFDRARFAQPGAVSRPPSWWGHQYFDADSSGPVARYEAVYEDSSGRADGYVAYEISAAWSENVPSSGLSVRDLLALTPDAYQALWSYLVGVDLVQTITSFNAPVDGALRWLLIDSRAMRTKRVGDWLWVRVLDTARVLRERRYAVDGSLVLEVRDHHRPGAGADGCFELAGGPDGAACETTSRAPELVLDVAELGSILLGGVAPSTLATAGLLEVREPAALGRADAMFRSTPQPFSMTWF